MLVLVEPWPFRMSRWSQVHLSTASGECVCIAVVVIGVGGNGDSRDGDGGGIGTGSLVVVVVIEMAVIVVGRCWWQLWCGSSGMLREAVASIW